VGDNADGEGIPGVKIPPEADLKRDLPRVGPLLKAGVITDKNIPESLKGDVNLQTRARIGDLRNDENLIVAQFHLAFLRFHNNVVTAIETNPKQFGLQGAGPEKRFRVARRLVRHHYTRRCGTTSLRRRRSAPTATRSASSAAASSWRRRSG
jgi:hypothetical protein